MSGGRVVVTSGFHDSSPAVWIGSVNATPQMANAIRDVILRAIDAGQRLEYVVSLEVNFSRRLSFTYRVTGDADELTALVAHITPDHPDPPARIMEEPLRCWPEWISTDEQLPEPDVTVLLWMRAGDYAVTHRYQPSPENPDYVGYQRMISEHEVTHWMPLPAPPPKGE